MARGELKPAGTPHQEVRRGKSTSTQNISPLRLPYVLVTGPSPMRTLSLKQKETAVRKGIRSTGRALVAYSGGIDSSLVLRFAAEELGDRVVAVTGVSPSLPSDELAHIQAFTTELAVEHRVLRTTELDDERYASNPPNRCFFCKSHLYDMLATLADDLQFDTIFDGSNYDDDPATRPGMKAALEHSIVSPLRAAFVSKADVRQLARQLGISFWEKPASPCLSSRVPHGTRITPEVLRQVDVAEAALRNIGFSNFRVRYHHDLARIEFLQSDIADAISRDRAEIVSALKLAGFRHVTIDLEGYRDPSPAR